MDVYIGTYTRGDSEGIYLLGLDMQTGELTNRGLAAKCEQPSFLAIHPDRSFLYAVGEYGKFGTENAGAIVAFSIDAESGKLVELAVRDSIHGREVKNVEAIDDPDALEHFSNHPKLTDI